MSIMFHSIRIKKKHGNNRYLKEFAHDEKSEHLTSRAVVSLAGLGTLENRDFPRKSGHLTILPGAHSGSVPKLTAKPYIFSNYFFYLV